MAEIVLSSAGIFLSPIIQVLFGKLISSDLIKFVREEKVHTFINKWKEMVETIKAVLNDAEDKQITNQAMKDWLGKLQFLAHDAEDILDLFATEILRRKLIAEPETQASTKHLINICVGEENDAGTHYRSGIYFYTPEQEKMARESLEQQEKKLNRKIVTEILPAKKFYRAEEYHQQYLAKGGRFG